MDDIVSSWCVCVHVLSCVQLSAPSALYFAKLLCPWILQARILEWVAISFSKGSFWPRDQTCVSCIIRWILYPLAPSGKPHQPGRIIQLPKRMNSQQQGNILFIFSQHLTTAQIRHRKSSSTSKPKALSLTSHTLEWLRGRAVLSPKSSVYGTVRLFAEFWCHRCLT